MCRKVWGRGTRRFSNWIGLATRALGASRVFIALSVAFCLGVTYIICNVAMAFPPPTPSSMMVFLVRLYDPYHLALCMSSRDTRVMDEAVKQKIEAFFGRYPARRLGKREVLIHAGDEPEGIFYLARGQVRQYDISPQGSEIVVNVFKPPAFFPMSWAVTGMPNRYFFETATNVELHVAPRQEAVNFLRGNPDVLFDLLRRVYSGAEGLQRRMAHLMGGTAKTRLVFELVTEGKRFGNQQPDGSVAVAVHEDELARRAGMSRETVNRELAGLKRQRLVSVGRQQLVIPDLDRLEHMLGEGL